jgi:hypothetical protein
VPRGRALAGRPDRAWAKLGDGGRTELGGTYQTELGDGSRGDGGRTELKGVGGSRTELGGVGGSQRRSL